MQGWQNRLSWQVNARDLLSASETITYRRDYEIACHSPPPDRALRWSAKLMGSFHLARAASIEGLSEIVGFKSGMVLTDAELLELLREIGVFERIHEQADSGLIATTSYPFTRCCAHTHGANECEP
jgi:hypothetical protein